MSDEADRIQAAQEAENAVRKHLAPAFAAVEQVYTMRMATVAAAEPWAVDKIRSLALALKVSQEARAHIEAIVAGGTVASASAAHLRAIEAMSPQRRRILGIG